MEKMELNKHTWNKLERRVPGRGNKLERRVPGRVNTPVNVSELFPALQQGWVAIPAPVIYNSSSPYLRDATHLLILQEDTPPIDVHITQSQNTK